MNRITKLLFVAFIVLIVGVACGNRGSNENLTVFVFDDQKSIGDDFCGGIVRRIYVVGPLPEDTPRSEIIEQEALLVYEEEIPFILPHEIEIVEEKTVYLKDLGVDVKGGVVYLKDLGVDVKGGVVYLKDLGVDPKDFSVTFSDRSEPSNCYIPQIGEIRWVVVSVDCYNVEAKKQEFILIDGSKDIGEWRDADPPYFWLQWWEDETVSETAILLDGSTVVEPEVCLVKERRIVYYQARVRPKQRMFDGWLTEPFGYQFCPVIVPEEKELTKELLGFTCSVLSRDEDGVLVVDFHFEPQELTEGDIAPVYRVEYLDGRVEYEWFRKEWKFGSMICGGNPCLCDCDKD